MRTLLILNDPPYGTERVYNGLRLAQALAKHRRGRRRRHLYDGRRGSLRSRRSKDPGRLLQHREDAKRVTAAGGKVLLCGTCMDARGLPADQMIEGAERSTMDALAQETIAADKVLVF